MIIKENKKYDPTSAVEKPGNGFCPNFICGK